MTGTRGRLSVRYRDDGTPPWAPFERLEVVTEGGARTHPLPAGKDLVELVGEAMRATVLDLADAVQGGRPPAADGRGALHVLEATLAAYGSAALGASMALPLSPDSPLHRFGVLGLQGLDLPEWSTVRQRGLFGVGP